MLILKRIFSTLALLTLAACGGGGGDSGTAPFPPGGGGGGGTTPTTPSAADLVLVLSASSVANNGTETVVATVTAIDSNRSTVTGVPVTVSVNNNGVITPSATTTNAQGQLSATVGIGADRSNRTLVVTATSGSIVKTATLQVQETGGGSSGTASDLLLTLGSATLANSVGSTVTVTATALDARRNILPGVVVSISADQGATVAPSGTTTNASGVVTAQIGSGGNPTLRTIRITATAAGLPARTVDLPVVATPSAENPVAADLSLALSANSLVNSGTATVTATATAVDNNRNALAGIPVTISVDSNAVASVSGGTTNTSGVVTATVGIGADRSNRSITVTASSGGITRTARFNVVGASLSASYSPSVGVGTTANEIEYRLVDFNSVAMAAQPISITRNGAPAVAGTTDNNGRYVLRYDAPAAATTLSFVAAAAGDTKTQTVAVRNSSVDPASSVPSSASLTPTPSVVSVNSAGSNANQVELRALFLGDNNRPVPNIRVRFSVDAANSSDGTATQIGGSTYAYSDAAGVARGTFTPGQRSSPTNGVTVRACWDTGDFDINAPCPANRLITATLTIASEALAVNIRTNNLIKIGPSQLTYIKEFVVMVVDAAGQAKPDVLITPSIDLTAYHKGVFVWNGTIWSQRRTLASSENYTWNSSLQRWDRGAATAQPQCPNEDANRNGVREAPRYDTTVAAPAPAERQEDLNWNGDLDPRKSDVAVKMVGSPRTDANGVAVLQIEYGQNLASWVDFVITVTASGVSGTEARATYAGLSYGLGNLPFPADAVGTENTPPAFAVSPYGRGFTGSVIPSPSIGVCTDSN